MNLVKKHQGAEEDAKTDEQLVELILNNHSELFARLYDRHYLKIYRITFGMTGSRETAEDLTQEIFLRAFQKLKQFSAASSFSTWLHRLAVNYTINHCQREKKNQHRTSTDDLILSDKDHEFEKAMVQKQLREIISEALSTLKPDLRMVVILKDIEGCNYEEIAQRMGCPIGTVGTWLNRGRLQLAKQLADYKGKF